MVLVGRPILLPLGLVDMTVGPPSAEKLSGVAVSYNLTGKGGVPWIKTKNPLYSNSNNDIVARLRKAIIEEIEGETAPASHLFGAYEYHFILCCFNGAFLHNNMSV